MSQTRAAADTTLIFPEPIFLLYVNRTLNLGNIKNHIFAVNDWNYAAYFKVRDQKVGGTRTQSPRQYHVVAQVAQLRN